jgi:flagellar hook protein FlgE
MKDGEPMLDTNFSALSGLSNASRRLQNSANNIANISKGSNVNVTEETVNQIVSKMTIQANVNVIKTNYETLGTILDIRS